MNTNLHPVLEVYDGVFNTASGKIVNLLKPLPGTLCLYDIAKGQSNTCRFGGQINEFYSVAKHTLLVWYLAPDYLKRAALLHDASEAYLGDVIKPLKVLLERDYSPFENCFTSVIFDKYGVGINLLPHIKPYDIAALGLEFGCFFNREKDLKNIFKSINRDLIQGPPFKQLLYLLRKEFGQYE